MAVQNVKLRQHAYLKACDILSSQSKTSKYQQAGEYFSELESNFIPENWMPVISADDLTNIALTNPKALSYIFSNVYFSDKLTMKHLTQLANHSLKAATHILYGKQFLKKFGRNKRANNLEVERYHFINTLAQNRVESFYTDQ